MFICRVHDLDDLSDDTQAQDAGFRLLAAAILRQAIDDLAIATEHKRAYDFLIHEYPTSLWREWLGFVSIQMVLNIAHTHDGQRRFRRTNTVGRKRGPYRKRVRE